MHHAKRATPQLDGDPVRPKAYSYIRMSTKEQLEGDSLRRQLTATQRFVEERGLNLIENYDDIGVSAFRGANAEKGALSRFRRAVEDGEIEPGSFLIIESMDRLTRQSAMGAVSLLNEIINHGIIVVTLDDRTEYSKETTDRNYGQLFIALGAFIRAHDESRRKSDLNSAAWANKREELRARRKILTATVPAWLQADKATGEIVTLPDRVAIVREVFDLTCGGYGIYSIARLLNERGERGWGKPRATKVRGKDSSRAKPIWRDSYIKKILFNRAVLGEFQPHKIQQVAGQRSRRVPDGDLIIGYYPRIISDEVYRQAHTAMDRRRTGARGRKGTNYSNLLSGLLHCSRCGSSMRYLDKRPGTEIGKYLRCSVSVSGGGCLSKAYKYGVVEETTLQFLQDLDVDKVLGGKANSALLAELRQHRTLAEIDLEGVQKKIELLNDALFGGTGSLPTTTTLRLHELAEQERSLRSRVQELSNKIEDLISADPAARRAALNKLLLAIRDPKNTALAETRRALAAELHRIVDSIVIQPSLQLPYEMEDADETWHERVVYTGRTRLDHFLEDHGFELIIKYRSGAQQIVNAISGTDLKLRWSQKFSNFTFLAKHIA